MLLFPAVRTPTTIALSASATAPAGMSESMRRTQSGTVTVFEYFTIVSPTKVTLPNIPAITLNVPPSTPLAGKSVYYGISRLNAHGGSVRLDTQGPGIVSGHTVSFAQVSTAITFEAGQKYTFVVYAPLTNIGASKIYVANTNNSGNSTVTTYNADGTQTTPTITKGLNQPVGIAVDPAGKIYVLNYFSYYGSGIVTTYHADGSSTTPTITAGLVGDNPSAIAVGANGKIYVAKVGFAKNGGSVKTYLANGKQTTPTITGLDSPTGVAVDTAGKIYVLNLYRDGGGSGSVMTFNVDGTRTTPTITAGLSNPQNIAVDAAGKIYVANASGDNPSLTTYGADGTQTAPTITNALNGPNGVAVDAAGKIYVVNAGGLTNGSVTTYNPDGTESIPTIFTGLAGQMLTGIAVR